MRGASERGTQRQWRRSKSLESFGKLMKIYGKTATVACTEEEEWRSEAKEAGAYQREMTRPSQISFAPTFSPRLKNWRRLRRH
jgi:hypothetical protein